METNPAPRAPKFNAGLSFSHEIPYDPFFGERIPLLHAFQQALFFYQKNRVQLAPSLAQRVTQLLRGKWRPEIFRAVECGVYTGSSLLACADLAREAGMNFQFDGLDTFSGLPELSEADKKYAPLEARYRNETLFGDTSVEIVRTKLAAAGLEPHVKLHPGLFSETFPRLPERNYHFVNIDCDLYQPHLECLEYFYPRMARSGVVFFDDYHSIDYPMARQAVDVFMKDKPEKLFHLRFGEERANRTKTYFVKY